MTLRHPRPILIFACFMLLSVHGAATSQAFAYLSSSSSTFDVPSNLKQRVKFWQHIFTRYGDEVIILHDRRRPWITIDFLFFDKLAELRDDDSFLQRTRQERIMERYLERYQSALERLAKEKKGALRYGKAERRLFRAYQGSRSTLHDLYSGTVRLRMQRGLADTFMQAAYKAQDYLPYFEKEFRQVGIPEQLTRLAFVESMFNPGAISKVGASGMWQFMKSTARHFMTVTRYVDERHSPFKAARAAAKMLKSDFHALGSWPLAVTAYNHGRGGMQRAVRQTGKHDLHHIIEHYESPTFGFASKNFYAEFLAAHHSYDHLIQSQRISIRPSRLDIAAVKLIRPTRIKDLSKVLGIKRHIIAQLNQCIKPQTFKYRLSYILPKNYRLYLPRKALETSLKSQKSLAFATL